MAASSFSLVDLETGLHDESKRQLTMMPTAIEYLCMIILYQVPNGWRYRRLGRTKLGNGKLSKFRKSSKNAQSPSRPVHAVLGCLYQLYELFIFSYQTIHNFYFHCRIFCIRFLAIGWTNIFI